MYKSMLARQVEAFLIDAGKIPPRRKPMCDPNLPDGVKQSDIDNTVGDTFDPDKPEDQVLILQKRIENIKTLCGYLDGHHPPTCNGWNTSQKRIIFQNYNCDCIISDILHEIEMSEDFI